MDITCANCGEPWDTHHLLHDEVHETEAGGRWIDHRLDCEEHEQSVCSLSGKMRREAKLRPPAPPDIERWERKLTPFWREQFAQLRWEFGKTPTCVLRCPSCKHNKPRPDAQRRRELHLLASDLLCGDPDGTACLLEDLDIVGM